MRMKQRQGQSTAPQFEVNSYHEQLSRERASDRLRFEMSYSLVTKRCVEAYERAKANHHGARPKP